MLSTFFHISKQQLHCLYWSRAALQPVKDFHVKFSLFAAGHRQHSSFHIASNKSNAQSLRSRPFPAQKHRHWAFDERRRSPKNDCLQFYSHCRLYDNTVPIRHTLSAYDRPSSEQSRYSWNDKNAIKRDGCNYHTAANQCVFNVLYSGDDGTQRSFQMKLN